MITFKSRLPNQRETFFVTMTRLANELKAINLGQGFPDMDNVNEDLISCVVEAMKKGFNQYTNYKGYPLLREEIAKMIKDTYHVDYNPETEITLTAGATDAIATILRSFIYPGDEVICFEPAYDTYTPNVEMYGGKMISIPLEIDGKVPWDKVKQVISKATKFIIFNNPNNPLGTIFTPQDFDSLEKIVQGTHIMILADEVYEYIVFDGKKHISLLQYPSLFERSFTVFSFGKTFNTTGWRIGYVVAPAYLTKEFQSIHQFNVYTCSTPLQVGIANHLAKGTKSYLTLSAQMQTKRNLFRKGMEQTPFKRIDTQATYFECYSYKHLSNISSEEMSIKLVKEYGVASIPISIFCKVSGMDAPILRFCFAKRDEVLLQACEKLSHYK